jgi:hypothetical protein
MVVTSYRWKDVTGDERDQPARSNIRAEDETEPLRERREPRADEADRVIVVALEDWTSRVTTARQKAPESGVAAALLGTVRSAEPAIALSPVGQTVMLSKNEPTPPSTAIAVDIGVNHPRLAPIRSFLRSKLCARRGEFFLLFR